ncbi:periplasmic heavy metal sensor [Halovulum sp. GXIMD14794]
MTDSPSTVERRIPRWAKAALTVSLAVNLAVIGLVGGAMLRGPDAPPPVNLPIEGFRDISAAMSEPDREALREDLRARRTDIRKTWTTIRAQNEAFLEALRAEPFQPAAVAEVLDAQAAQWEAFGAGTREILVQRIDAMTPEARVQFADMLEQRLRERRDRFDKRRHGKEGRDKDGR